MKLISSWNKIKRGIVSSDLKEVVELSRELEERINKLLKAQEQPDKSIRTIQVSKLNSSYRDLVGKIYRLLGEETKGIKKYYQLMFFSEKWRLKLQSAMGEPEANKGIINEHISSANQLIKALERALKKIGEKSEEKAKENFEKRFNTEIRKEEIIKNAPTFSEWIKLKKEALPCFKKLLERAKIVQYGYSTDSGLVNIKKEFLKKMKTREELKEKEEEIPSYSLIKGEGEETARVFEHMAKTQLLLVDYIKTDRLIKLLNSKFLENKEVKGLKKGKQLLSTEERINILKYGINLTNQVFWAVREAKEGIREQEENNLAEELKNFLKQFPAIEKEREKEAIKELEEDLREKEEQIKKLKKELEERKGKTEEKEEES